MMKEKNTSESSADCLHQYTFLYSEHYHTSNSSLVKREAAAQLSPRV